MYDAWGKIVSITDGNGNDVSNDPTHIANINPIRYRSYYYDRETNLYYLETRYYDPETGRFLNADNLGYMEPETVTGLNLYAYCGNNPVMYFDPTGHLFVSIVLSFIALGGIAYGTYKGVKAYQEAKESGATGVELFKETATAVVEGLVEGGIVGGLVGVGVATIATGGASFFGGTILAPALASGGSVAVGGAVASGAIATLGAIDIGLTLYEQKKAAPRVHSNSRKKAYDKAFYKGGKKRPIFHAHGEYGPHFHPASPKYKHWHYYFTFLFGVLESMEE